MSRRVLAQIRIIWKLRWVVVFLAQEMKVSEICRKLGVSKHELGDELLVRLWGLLREFFLEGRLR